MSLVSLEERQMSPNTPIDKLRAELKSLEKYCTSQLSLMQGQLDEERRACMRRHDEIKALIQKLVQDSIEQKRLDAEYRKASGALGQKHSKILIKLLERVGCAEAHGE